MSVLENLCDDPLLDWNVNSQAMNSIYTQILRGAAVQVETTQTLRLERLEYWSSNNNTEGTQLYSSQTFLANYDADQPLPIDPLRVGDPSEPLTYSPGFEKMITYGIGHPMLIVGVSHPNGDLEQDQFTYTLHLLSKLGEREFYHELHDSDDNVAALHFPLFE